MLDQVEVCVLDGPFMKGGCLMRQRRLSHAGICEMVQSARIPPAGQSSPVEEVQDAPYRKTREKGSKDGCLGNALPIPIVS